jgi:hypothetical protein
VSIEGDTFLINGQPTLKGVAWRGYSLEGLLPNSRMVQGAFDDLNPDTRGRWVYPDTKTWDPDRNTREFVAAMPEWRRHGLLAVTLNLQGGSPEGYSQTQPWHNSAFTEDGSLRPEYMVRVERILNEADRLGMAVILGLFYFGQDERLRDEQAVVRAVEGARSIARGGRRLLVSTSYGGNTLPGAEVLAASDFVLLHGNGVSNPDRIAEMVRQTRAMPAFTPMPVVFNEDDHYDFEKPRNNFVAATSEHASWGFFDFRRKEEGFDEGYQSVPVNWGISSARKRGFFSLLREMTGGR